VVTFTNTWVGSCLSLVVVCALIATVVTVIASVAVTVDAGNACCFISVTNDFARESCAVANLKLEIKKLFLHGRTVLFNCACEVVPQVC